MTLTNISKIRKNPDPWHDVVIPGLDGRDGAVTIPGQIAKSLMPHLQETWLIIHLAYGQRKDLGTVSCSLMRIVPLPWFLPGRTSVSAGVH